MLATGIPHPVIHRCILFNFDLKSKQRLLALHNSDITPDREDNDVSVIATNAASPAPSPVRSLDKLKARKVKVLVNKVLVNRTESLKRNLTSPVDVPYRGGARFQKPIISDNSSNLPSSVTQDSVARTRTMVHKDSKSSESDADDNYDKFYKLAPGKPRISSFKRTGPEVLLTQEDGAMAFTTVIEGKSCVIADQSGSGKTLAYLVPIIQRVRREELEGGSKSIQHRPHVIIMVPTAELASQVLNNCRSLSKFGVPFRSMAVTGGFSQRTQLENLEQGIDVLISTPGRFMFLVKEGFLKLSNLKCAVLDELDILFNDEEFEVALKSLMNFSPVETQYLFVTATLPVGIYNKLIEIFPDCRMIMGPGMHRTSARLEELLVDCSGDAEADRTPETAFHNKRLALLQVIEQRPVFKTIIFCNKIETCRKVENVLKRFDRKGRRLRVLPFHSAVAQESRRANMKEFMTCQSENDNLFLVCTDRASRGVDFDKVDHVVLFDFPRDPSEYVRRVGRTARGAMGRGKAFIFVVGKQVPLAQKIIDRNQKGHPVHDVPSSYELMS